MEKVSTFLDNKMKDTTDLKQFKDIRNDHFKKKNVKVRDRNEAFLKLFPKLHLSFGFEVGIIGFKKNGSHLCCIDLI